MIYAQSLALGRLILQLYSALPADRSVYSWSERRVSGGTFWDSIPSQGQSSDLPIGSYALLVSNAPLFTACTVELITLMPSLNAGHQWATSEQTEITHVTVCGVCGTLNYPEKRGNPQEVGCLCSGTFNWW